MRHMLKKAAAMLLCAAIIILAASTAFAAPDVDAAQTTELCSACMLVDAKTGTAIYAGETATQQIPPASTTKILTAMIILENCDLSEMVTVGSEVETGGSKLGLVVGEKMSVKELLYGMMLVSGNDCAAALAVHCGGSIEGFAEMMNAKAAELDMDSSHFVNPNGLDNDEHYVTAEDMAKVTLYAMNNPMFMDIVGTKTHTFAETNKSSERSKWNTNKLLYKPDNDAKDYRYSYTTGIKTGSTAKGGGCLVASAEKNGMTLIALVYGDPTKNGVNRWGIAKYLLEYGFENYTTKNLSDMGVGLTAQADVTGAGQADGSKGISRIGCHGEIPENTYFTVDKASMSGSEVTVEFVANGILEAPVYEGDVIGKMVYKMGGAEVFSCDAIASESALETLEMQATDSPIRPIASVDVGKSDKTDITADNLRKLWWWALLPLGAALLLVIFMIIKVKGGFGSLTFSQDPKYSGKQRSTAITSNAGRRSSSARRRSRTYSSGSRRGSSSGSLRYSSSRSTRPRYPEPPRRGRR